MYIGGCGWSIDVDQNHSFNLLVHEVLEYFSCYERSGYGLKGSKEKIIQKVEPDYFY